MSGSLGKLLVRHGDDDAAVIVQLQVCSFWRWKVEGCMARCRGQVRASCSLSVKEKKEREITSTKPHELHFLDAYAGEAVEHLQTHLLHLYIFAHRYETQLLRDDIMSALYQFEMKHDFYPHTINVEVISHARLTEWAKVMLHKSETQAGMSSENSVQ